MREPTPPEARESHGRLAFRLDHGLAPSEWPPFIDATYAIILTLMVIELPDVVIELLKELNKNDASSGDIANSLLRLIFGYLTVFIMTYDIWVKKRRLLAASEGGLASQTIALVISLFIVTLVPPLFFIKNQLYQAGALLHHLLPWPDAVEIGVADGLLLVLLVTLYGLIAFSAYRMQCHIRHQKRHMESPRSEKATLLDQKLHELIALRSDSILRIALIPAVMFTLYLSGMPPPLPALVYSLTAFIRLRPRRVA